MSFRLIYLAGIDGSGKSTQAERYVGEAREQGRPWVYRWARWEPWITGPVMALGRRFVSRGSGRGSTRPEDDEGYESFTSGKQKLFSRKWIRTLWAGVVLLEYLPQVWWRLGLSLVRGKIVLCDRYLPDVWVDLAVNFSEGKEGVLRLSKHPLCRLFPRIDRMVFLDVEPKVGYQRKNDGTPLHYLEDRRPLYLSLEGIIDFTRVDANGSIEEVSEALGKVLAGEDYR